MGALELQASLQGEIDLHRRWPNRRCIEVYISYLPMPSALEENRAVEPALYGKMASSTNELFFEKRPVYMRGLSDIAGGLVLTME